MILIDGKKIAAELRKKLKEEVSNLKVKYKKVPGLSVILIGDLAPSQIYVKNKEKSLKSATTLPPQDQVQRKDARWCLHT